jgi:hypothetical protein
MSDGLPAVGVDELLTRLDAIHLTLPEWPHGPVVYVLRDSDGDVIYVGKTINLPARIGAHRRLATATTAVTADIIRCQDEEEMHRVEGWLIARFRPPLNDAGNPERRAERAERTFARGKPDAAAVAAARRALPADQWSASASAVGRAVLTMMDDGTAAIMARDLVAPAIAAGLSRPWVYRFLAELEIRGLVEKTTSRSGVTRWKLNADACRKAWSD